MFIFQEGFNEVDSGHASFSGYERDFLVVNNRGQKLKDISGVSGVDNPNDGRATVFADFDNDGDTDILTTAKYGHTVSLYRNNVGQDRSFVRIALKGTRSGTDAFGAVVRLGADAGVLTKVKTGGSGYMSQKDPRLLFGLDEQAETRFLSVKWPSGLRQEYPAPRAGDSWLLIEGEDEPVVVNEKRFSLPTAVPRRVRLFQSLKFSIGDPLPDLDVLFEGRGAPLASMLSREKPTLLNLWATWCGPCQQEMKTLDALSAGPPAPEFSVIGVNVDDRSTRNRVAPFLAEHGIRYPNVLLETEEIAKVFRSDEIQIPMSILIGADGKVIGVYEGWSREARRRLERLVRGDPAAD